MFFLFCYSYCSMLKVQQRVSQGQKVLQYYTTKAWDFKNENFLQLYDGLNNTDKAVFYFDLKEVKQYQLSLKRSNRYRL